MSFDVDRLTEERHAETQHPRADWRKALESAAGTLKPSEIDSADLESLARASRSPARFTSTARLIYQEAKAHPAAGRVAKTIIDVSSESPFSTSDWIDAFHFFSKWLADRGRAADLRSMFHYLECCAASPDARKSGQTLLALADDMLRACGYDG